ncbi:MAG: thiopurine S-methyltransferase [Cocleimonas sp.]|jgi:thiopurine S-methyltransferase
MKASFWHQRWKLGEIAFHEQEANHLLVHHLGKLNLVKGSRIFLPLCGKTTDIAYLMSHGYCVTGVELSEIAIQELFHNLEIIPTISVINQLKYYHAEGIDIFVGDFFDLNENILGKTDAIYDRATLVALPFEMRKSYTQHLTKITNNAAQLLICFEYNQAIMDGPPFSISPDEIRQHYGNIYSIDSVEKKDIIGGLKRKRKLKNVRGF